MRKIWGSGVLRSSRCLDSRASRLRTKLARAGAPGFVLNLHGVGYKPWEGERFEISG